MTVYLGVKGSQVQILSARLTRTADGIDEVDSIRRSVSGDGMPGGGTHPATKERETRRRLLSARHTERPAGRASPASWRQKSRFCEGVPPIGGTPSQNRDL